MESAVRYDFSFPPKSTSINNNNIHTVSSNMANTCGTSHISHSHSHNIFNNNRNNFQQNYNHQVNSNVSSNQTNGLSKSASTSLLTTCASHQTNVNINNNNNPKYANNNICNCCNTAKTDANITTNNNNNNAFNLNSKSGLLNKNGCNKNVQSQQNHHQVIIGAPATPKDGNCSFTFDDLKSTFAFMEDSPLVSATNSNNSHVAPPPTQILTVKLDSNTQSDSSTSVSSLSSASSSSSGSSSSSCNSCYVPTYLPKSNSNPMLLSAGSNSSSNTSPTSIHSKKNTNDQCSCTEIGPNHQHQQQSQFQNNSGSVLDLLIKKSSSDLENHTESHFQHGTNTHNHHNHRQNLYANSSNSLVTTTNSLNINSNTLLSSIQQTNQNGINVAIESAARRYRCAAQISEASCCWKGKLPPKQYKTPIVYSTKVFVGGLPWDITEEDILKEFGQFGPCRVEWTNKEKFNLLSNSQQMDNSSYQDNVSSNHNQNNNNNPYQYQNSNQSFRSNRSISNLQQSGKQMNNMNSQNNQNGNSNGNSNDMNASKHRLSPGFTYVIYDNEYSVRSLVGNCIEDYQNGRDRVEYYFKISTRRVRNKEVQIIPWILADNNFALCTPKELDPKKTVFVGNLHGTMTARDLAHIMNELFGCVVYAGIDIDKLKYPIGSGRVTFSHQQNFMKAVRAAFVDIQSSKFSKRIQIDPYLEDVECCMCYADKGIYFCRDFQCFKYYCGGCWEKQHSYNQLGNHKPLMRKREDKIM